MTFSLADYYTQNKPSDATLQEVQEGWKTVTPEEIAEWDIEDLSEHYYHIYDAIKKVITKEQLEALVALYNNAVQDDDDTSLPELLDCLFQEVHENIVDTDLDHNSEEKEVIYKTPFDTYYFQWQKGNYNWHMYGELEEVKKVLRTVVDYIPVNSDVDDYNETLEDDFDEDEE